MSTEVNRVNGDTESRKQQPFMTTVGNEEKNDPSASKNTATTTAGAGKLPAAQPAADSASQRTAVGSTATAVPPAKTAVESSLETSAVGTTAGCAAPVSDGAASAAGSSGNQPSGATPSTGSRSQKSKKRQNQKTYSLFDIFDMHQTIGSWADAAADVSTPSYSLTTQKSPEAERQVPRATQQASASQGDWNQYPRADGGRHPPPPGLDRASHSRSVDLANLPDRPPFEVKVANINYKSSDDDLLYFFGGERNVVNIRSENQPGRRGIAIVSFSSQEALVNALNLNGTELQGRPLRISLREYQPRTSYGSSNLGPNNSYAHYRSSGSYQHEGGYSTLPHPRRGPPPAPYHNYSDGRANRLPPQQYSSYRGRDNRRYDYDNRSLRHPRPGNNQFYPRYANRSFDSYGMPPRPPPHNENHFVHHGPELDDDRRGPGRIRTESVRSNATDGTERHERRKLQLQPRTKPLDSAEEDLPARPTSIFGLAKPVDTYEKERQVEERLRLENEAFKATEQRSRKSSSEHGASVPASPVLPHGHISIMNPSLPEDRENHPPTVQETVLETKPAVVENVEKAVPPAEVSREAVNEEHVEVSAEASAFTPMVPSLPPLPRSLPPPPPSSHPTVPGGTGVPTARRSSFSTYPEMPPDTRPTATLPRARNSYNRTFTRSRDSVRNQIPTSKQQNIPVRRGKSGSRRGGANGGGGGGGSAQNKERRFAAGKEKFEDSSAGSVAAGGQKQPENGPKLEQQPVLKDQKHDSVSKAAAVAPTNKQSSEQHQERQQSKKEKKKQVAATKEMPKYVEPKPFSFSSQNKYAALLEADD